MSYLVIARKWRPQTFKEVIGQRHVVQTLGNALSSGRIAHGYLFSGVRGVGKTTVARILAKSLNCDKGITNDPCNECISCKEVANGSSIDVIEIDGASNTGVDDVREIKDNVKYLPSKGRYKIYIIDEVHMLSTSAFNALLKTLEEPPPHVVFIFATTEPHKIPLTVLSRCQRFDFSRLTNEEVKCQLNMITSKDGIKINDDAISLIAKQAEGSMRDAQSLLDQIVSYAGTEITSKEVADILGLMDKDVILEALKSLIKKDAERALKVIEKAYNFGYDEKRFTQNLLEYLKDFTIIKSIRNPERFLDYPSLEIQEIECLLEGIEIEDLQIIFRHLSKGLEDIARSSYPRVILEMLFLKIIGLPPMRSITEIMEKLGSLEKKGKNLPSTVEANEREQQPQEKINIETKPEEAEEQGSRWGNFLEFVMKKKPSLGSHLNSVQIISQDDKKIALGVSKGISFDYLMDIEVKDNLEGFYRDFFGKAVRINIKEVSEGVKGEKIAANVSMYDGATLQEGMKGERLPKKAPQIFRGANSMSNSFVENVVEIFGENIQEISK